MSERSPIEIKTNIPVQDKLNSLKEFVVAIEGQSQIVDFVEDLKTELGNKDNWKKICEQADQEQLKLTDSTLLKIIDRFEPYIQLMPPGHDPGHFRRDLIDGIIISDSVMRDNLQLSQSDCLAGLMAGAFHDIGTSIIPRYEDRELGAGHAETGAWLFNELTEDLLGENLRKLTSYSISAHTNLQKEIVTKNPPDYIKKPYFDETWQEDDKLIGLGYKITRMADRLDTNGAVFSLRHIMAHFDKKQESSSDFSGGQWFDINEESLKLVLKPEVRDPAPKTPTTLEHVFNFKKSNYGNSVYSKDDYLFPKFEEILKFETDNFDKMVNSMESDQAEIPSIMETTEIKSLFLNVSGSSPELFEPMWDIFEKYWRQLNENEKHKWTLGFNSCKETYQKQIELYRSNIDDSLFPETLKETIDKLEKQ